MAEKKDYDKIHNTNTEIFAQKVTKLFEDATKEGANIAMLVSNFNDDKVFSFADYPITKDRVHKLVTSLSTKVETVVLNGIDHEWTLSNNKNSELSRLVFGDNIGKLTKEQEQRYFNNNLSARDAFKKRETSGLKLSDRVWNYTSQFKTDIELGIDIGLRDKLSAVEMARDLKQYLVYPDKLFRRVRDQHGHLQLSKAAKAFNPGRGIYRSSVRNAQRLTRTEINIAYHTADHERWQQLDFVVGIEVRRSNNTFNCPVCESLKGKYPKDFMFTGWHPQCRCHAVSILKTPEELNSSKPSINEVKSTPKGFDTWIEKNKDRFGSKNTPYFIRDNYVDGKIDKGLNFTKRANKKPTVTPSAPPKPVVAPVKHIKSGTERANIQQRWDKRKEGGLDSIISTLNKVKYNEVSLLRNELTELEIIERLGGGDMTKGSCSSLAFAYAGNKGGLDVLDFRGGASMSNFASSRQINEIANKVGGVVIEAFDDFKGAKELLTHVKVGKEYYFTCGRHAAIVRKSNSGYEYLELQSAISNGFKNLNTSVLKRRFGAKKSHTTYGSKYSLKECIIDIELLQSNRDYKRLLGYINTGLSKQLKGAIGAIK